MARPSKEPVQLGLTPAARPAEPVTVPSLVDYAVNGDTWLCKRFDLLVAEFETVTVETLPRFHAAASLNARRWLIVRRLFSVQPQLPPAGFDPEDLRDWGRDELGAALGLTRPQLKQELDAVRGTWQGWQKGEAAPPVTAAATVGPSAPPEELPLAEDPLLAQYGFGDLRLAHDERAWFLQRVRDFERVLKEKLVGGLAYNALVTELRARRLNRALDNYEPKLVGSAEWVKKLALAQDLARTYDTQIEKILELCPWASAIAGKQAFLGVVSEITKALAEYHASNATRLIDGIYTATELQVLARRSVQMPEPRYRAGRVVYLNAARAGLFDPRWQPPLPDKLLRVWDQAWTATFMAADDAPLPDLEADGPEGEYAELVVPEERKKDEG